MLENRIVYLNGKFSDWSQATVPIMSHSFGRGSAIFEVISCHASDAGPVIFRLEDHIRRLFKTADFLDMKLPLSQREFCEATAGTVKRNQINEGVIKIVCYYPQISVEVRPPSDPLDVSIFALDLAQDLPGGGLRAAPTTAALSKWRKLDPQTVPIQAKAAANYLNGMVARLEAGRRGFETAVMLDTQGFIAEGSTESVFLVKEGRLMTPALGTILDSISRKSVLKVAEANGIQTFEGRLDPELLFQAEEMFFSCSPRKVWAIKQIEDRLLPEAPGPVTQKVEALLDNIVRGKDTRFKDWLYPVR